MARKTQQKQVEKPVVKVRCCDCRLFTLDTEGPSFSATTGVYFMGRCPNLHADGIVYHDDEGKPVAGHVFADKARVCNDFTK